MLKAPSNEGAFSIFVTGKKKSASSYFLKTLPLLKHAGIFYVNVLCLD